MNDPTNSRYRYISFKGSDVYRRYVKDDDSQALLESKLKSKIPPIPAHGSYGGLLFDSRWKKKRAEILSRRQSLLRNLRKHRESSSSPPPIPFSGKNQPIQTSLGL